MRLVGLRVLNNYIGTDLTGAVDLGNQGHGVEAAGSSLVIGELGAGNLISGNQGAGVRLRDVGNVIQANVISANDADGVQAVGLSQGNAILTNSIFGNAGLGIDLNDDGVTANDLRDPDVGPNLRQNFPEVTGVGAGGTNVVGTLNSRPNSVYTIQLFENAQCDPSEHGEGETFLVATQVTTDASGDAGFAVTLPTAVPGGHVVTATATDSQDNTSEHSRCNQPPPTATIVVEKQTEPDGSSEEFSFTGDVVGAIGDGETIEVSVSAPGTYSSREAVPTGWDLKGITCDDSDSSGAVGTATATFRVIANETVTCTFTNTKRGSVTLKKTTNGVVDPSKDIISSSPARAAERRVTRSTFGDQDGVLEFGGGNLIPGPVQDLRDARSRRLHLLLEARRGHRHPLQPGCEQEPAGGPRHPLLRLPGLAGAGARVRGRQLPARG